MRITVESKSEVLKVTVKIHTVTYISLSITNADLIMLIMLIMHKSRYAAHEKMPFPVFKTFANEIEHEMSDLSYLNTSSLKPQSP